METSLSLTKYKAYVDFMLSQQQWSGINRPIIDSWLKNFDGSSNEEMLLVYKLLTSLIYYSEEDVISVLQEGINNCLFNHIVLEEQKRVNFTLSQHALDNIIKSYLSETCFVPLADSNSPHESGNYVTRLLVQQGFIKQEQSMFVTDLMPHLEKKRFSRVVIVDDCVGSGNQLREFWSKKAEVLLDGKAVLLKDICSECNIDVSYLTLFGYNKSIAALKDEINELNIHCVRMLTDRQRVFSSDSYIWGDEGERTEAKAFFQNITDTYKIPLLGYADLDFAFVMHRTMPDWSLPLFWIQSPDWKLLFRRKNSDV